MQLSSTQINTIKKSSLILRAINHPLRRSILEEIGNSKDGIITVTELYVHLKLEQSVASQHLAILRKANIVSTIREGKFIKYKVNDAVISDMLILCDSMNALLKN